MKTSPESPTMNDSKSNGTSVAAFDSIVFSNSSFSLAFLKTLFDAIPSPVLLFNQKMTIVALNKAAAALSEDAPMSLLKKRNGDAFNCLNIQDVSTGCATGPCCGNCVVLRSLKLGLTGNRVERARTKLELCQRGKVKQLFCLITASPLEFDGERFCLVFLEDISELVELQGILPICSYCKKIRNDEQAWQQMEGYLSNHLDMTFSHGICPDCMKIQMAQIEELKKRRE